MNRTPKGWWDSVSQRRDQLLLDLNRAKAPYAERKRAMLTQQAELLREACTPYARLHLQRLTAVDLITEAYAARATWEEFGPLLRRCQRLGYADITHRIHVACLYVQSLARFPNKAGQAFSMLAEAEQMLKRIRRNHYLRREGTQAIAHARAVAASTGITPLI